MSSARPSGRRLGLVERWNRWVGGGWLRRAILDAAVKEGLGRHSSVVHGCRLEAIERPGWIQVFAFELEDSAQDPPALRYGVLRDDGRKTFAVRLFEAEPERAAQQAEWSEGLLVRRRTEPSRTRTVLLLLFAVVVLAAILGAVLGGPADTLHSP